ncbi:unnamed protein product [Sphagnum jensenii]|uniref:Uncharacterized protein n=1 Tax=Sphagnum jensenii TaxID=128206 RepID=A0ABP1ANG5_9BRYO
MDDTQWQSSTGLRGFAEKECKAIHEMMVIEFVKNYELDTNRSTVRGCNICLDKKVIMAVFHLPGEGSQPRLTRVENFDASLFFDADDPGIYVATQGFVIDKMRSFEDQIRFRALTEALVLKQVLKYTSASFLEAVQRALEGEAIDWASYYLIGAGGESNTQNSTESHPHCCKEEEDVEVQRGERHEAAAAAWEEEEQQEERHCRRRQQQLQQDLPLAAAVVAKLVKAEPEGGGTTTEEEERRVEEVVVKGSSHQEQLLTTKNTIEAAAATTRQEASAAPGMRTTTSPENKPLPSVAEMQRLAERNKRAYTLSEGMLLEEKKRNIHLLQKNEEMVQDLARLQRELNAIKDRAITYKRISKEWQARVEQLQHKANSDGQIQEQMEKDLRQREADLKALKSEMVKKEELARVHEYYAVARAQSQVQVLEKQFRKAQRQSMPAYEQLMAECGEFKLKALLYDALLLSVSSGEKRTQFVDAQRHYQRWLDAERVRYSRMMNHILEFFAEEEDNAEEEEIAEESKVVGTTPMTTTAAAAAAVGALHTDLKQLQNPVLYPPPHRCHFHNFIPIARFCSLMQSSSSNAPSCVQDILCNRI